MLEKAKVTLTSILLLSSLAFLTGSFAQAQVVTTPEFNRHVDVNASLLYLQATSSSLDYGIHTQPEPLPTPHWRIQSINHDYEPGFTLGLGTTFPKTSNDAQLSWTTFSDSQSNGIGVAENQFVFVGPFFEIGPDTGTIKQVKGNSKFRYNALHFSLGQFLTIGCMRTRLFTGISGVSITQHMHSTFSNQQGIDAVIPILPDFHFSLTMDNISKFTGLGPRFGIATAYQLRRQLHFIADFAAAAYIGRMRAALESLGVATDLLNNGIPENPQSINSDNANRLVPALDGKLGVNYCFRTWQKDVTLEGGYQFAVYFHAIRQVFPTTLAELAGNIIPIQSGGIFVGTMGQSQSHFSVGGPYLNLAVTL